MAPSLPDLPAELLLKTIESLESDWDRTFLLKQLWNTSSQINEKLVYHLGTKKFQKIRMGVNRKQLTLLPVIARGHLGTYVRYLTLLTRPLVIADDFLSDEETTDASVGSWYSEKSDQLEYLRWRFNDDVMGSITDAARDDCSDPTISVPLFSLDLVGMLPSTVASLQKLCLGLTVDVPQVILRRTSQR
ncbi:hypothetical protein E8E11_011653 [Didymella keratinophila]|nr:hypothetical protein E8E11_011653 [Didymella keratinophila]